MKNLLQNHVGCNLMVWETDTKKRNNGSEVKLYVNEKQELNRGDILVGIFNKKSFSCYEITKIISRKKGTIEGKDYLTVTTNWSRKLVDFHEFNLKTNKTFNNLYNIL